MLAVMDLERTSMDNKLLVATLPEPQNWSEWARVLKMSRPSIYKWRARYREFGLDGLVERSRAPISPAGRTSGDVEDRVVRLRKELADAGLDAGAATIGWHLGQDGVVVSDATVWRILGRRGLITPSARKGPRKQWHRFERERPNDLWQLDDTDYVLGSGTIVKVINMIDDRSRLVPESRAVPVCTSKAAWQAFLSGAARYGLPRQVLTDNARAFHSLKGDEPCWFQQQLVTVGIDKIKTAPYHPQTNGKVERFHQTQHRWLDAHPVARTIVELQALLDTFREIYNTARPHRALGRRIPQDVFDELPKATPALAAVTIEDQFVASSEIRALRADARGQLSRYTHSIALGVEWATVNVVYIRHGLNITICDPATGEIIRRLILDTTKRNQPGGRKRGGPKRDRKTQ
jgi:transposase InsO family protein